MRKAIHRRFESGLIQRFLLLASFLVIMSVAATKAELTWVQKTVEVAGDASTPTMDAHFKFTNTGKGPVEIRNVESSCGCTTTALEKRLYHPQESGDIIAKYTPGTHTGEQRKTLLVTTNDGKPPTTLTLVARIPEILRITPTVVTWSHNEATAPKSITLELVQDPPVDEINVVSTSPNVKTDLVAVTRGRKYTLSVSPKQTDRFLSSKLTVRCRFGSQEKTFVAYATVKPSSGEH